MTILQQILPEFALKFFEFLGTPLFPYIQIWTILHFVVGFLIFYLIRKEKYALLVLLELLIAFEFLEYGLSYGFEFLIGTPIILKELFWDSFLDIGFGFLGGLIMYFILKRKV